MYFESRARFLASLEDAAFPRSSAGTLSISSGSRSGSATDIEDEGAAHGRDVRRGTAVDLGDLKIVRVKRTT